jgi:hypothetical protein
MTVFIFHAIIYLTDCVSFSFNFSSFRPAFISSRPAHPSSRRGCDRQRAIAGIFWQRISSQSACAENTGSRRDAENAEKNNFFSPPVTAGVAF